MDYDDIALKEIKKIQKQVDLLTLGLLQEKDKVCVLLAACEIARGLIAGIAEPSVGRKHLVLLDNAIAQAKGEK
jgi:hypothetical protein